MSGSTEPARVAPACAIVVSFQTGPALHDCLNALMAAYGVAEIVLVDNGNARAETEALDMVAANDVRAQLVRGQGNIGFAAACNLGARAAQSEVLAFVNPDVVLEPDAIARLVSALVHAPAPAIIGGDLRDIHGGPDRGGRRERLTLWRALVSYAGLSRFERLVPAFRDFNRRGCPPEEGLEAVAAVSGALMLLRRCDFEALGGFDEGYFMHVEDVDLCRRAEDAGWRVLFQPGPHGVHRRSTSAVSAGAIARHKARGLRRYFRKFARGPLETAIAEAVGAVFIAVSALRG